MGHDGDLTTALNMKQLKLYDSLSNDKLKQVCVHKVARDFAEN